jgi:hypothetical protein
MTAVVALLAVGVLASPAHATTGQDLSGEWLNSAYTLSAFQLGQSADGKTLTATWNVNIGKLNEGLLGRFKGTLNASGTAFTGPMHVSVGSLSIGGTMTFTIDSQQRFGYPLLTVSYQQDDGISGTETLEMWLLPPKLAPSPKTGVSFEFLCPGPRACQDGAELDSGGTASKGIVDSVRFTIEPGDTRQIRLSLDETGRQLLAKRRSLSVQVLVVSHTKSLTLPPLTKLSTLTFHAK